MGKNHKHKKKLKSEKAKVHIKSKTKFLPKGQNETKATFKIKPIVIQEQLKEKDVDISIDKHEKSVPELVKKLKHSNDKLKVEACEELVRMVKKYSIKVFDILTEVFQYTSLLVQDRERKVRVASVKLLDEIMKAMPPSKVEPFFNYMSTNLRCAMTHINKHVQEDSLLLLDSLLEHCPGLVSKESYKIFPSLLALISSLRRNSGVNRTLTINLGGKLASFKWRIMVLSRLHGFLKATIEQEKRQIKSQPLTLRADEITSIPLPGNSEIYETCPIDFFGDSEHLGNYERILNLHIGTLVPLLFETWLEIAPEKTLKKQSSDGTVLSAGAAVILNCILSTLDLLLAYSRVEKNEEIFNSEEARKFFDYLLVHFPYAQTKENNPEHKELLKLFPPRSGLKCVHENILVCYLFSSLKIDFAKPKIVRPRVNLITSYLNEFLTSHVAVGSSNFRYLISILREVLLENPKLWRNVGVNINQVRENAISFSKELPGEQKEELEYICLMSQTLQR